MTREAFLPFSVGKWTDSTDINALVWDWRIKMSIKKILVIYFKSLVENKDKINVIIFSNVPQSN